MVSISSEFVERYQKVYEKDPDSRVFAPLAEAYRRMGLLDQAHQICKHGVACHPDFAGGRVAMAKVLIDLGESEQASEHLKIAVSLAPENILAHQLLAELWLKLRRPKEALSAYKMVLLLNPSDSKAKKIVRKLESLTADEYDDDLFEMQPLSTIEQSSDFISKKLSDSPPGQTPAPQVETTAGRLKGMERLISLADAFIARNDMNKADQTLSKAEAEFGSHPEILRRREMLNSISQMGGDPSMEEEVATPLSPLPTRQELALRQKRELLEGLLAKIQDQRNSN